MTVEELEELYLLTEKGFKTFIFPALDHTAILEGELENIDEEVKYLISFYFGNHSIVDTINKRKKEKQERIQQIRKKAKNGKKAAG